MKKYLITILAGLLAVFLILWAKDIFVQTETVAVFHILCDAFFAVKKPAAATGSTIIRYSASTLGFSKVETTRPEMSPNMAVSCQVVLAETKKF